jgi:hypothetical protein
MNDPQLDMHMRKTALDATIKLFDTIAVNPDEVVAAATTFYQFLKGDTK